MQAISRDAIPRGPGRALLVVAIGSLAIAVLAIALVMVRGDRTATYPPDSPEAGYQAFLAAWNAGDGEAAYALLSAHIRATWPEDAYLSEFAMRASGAEGTRVLIERSTQEGDRATLGVVVESYYGGGLTSSRSRRSFQVRMLREDGAWRIDERLAWPGPVGW